MHFTSTVGELHQEYTNGELLYYSVIYNPWDVHNLCHDIHK